MDGHYRDENSRFTLREILTPYRRWIRHALDSLVTSSAARDESSVATLAGLAGCLSGPSDTSTDSSPSETDTSSESVSVASLSVADFIVYPLAGTHPHVHRVADTQYVVVGIDADRDAGTVRKRLALELDGEG